MDIRNWGGRGIVVSYSLLRVGVDADRRVASVWTVKPFVAADRDLLTQSNQCFNWWFDSGRVRKLSSNDFYPFPFLLLLENTDQSNQIKSNRACVRTCVRAFVRVLLLCCLPTLLFLFALSVSYNERMLRSDSLGVVAFLRGRIVVFVTRIDVQNRQAR